MLFSDLDSGVLPDRGQPTDSNAGEASLADSPADRGTGAAPPCYKDTDCPANKLHCDVDTHLCVECVADANCVVAPYFRCDAAVHRCVECLTVADCGSNAICHPDTRICIIGCAGPGDCPLLQPFCDSRGWCVECRTSADCAQTDLCDPTIGRCAFCTDDRGCSAPTPYCDVFNPGRNRCKECLEPQQCPPDRPYCDVHGRVCLAVP